MKRPQFFEDIDRSLRGEDVDEAPILEAEPVPEPAPQLLQSIVAGLDLTTATGARIAALQNVAAQRALNPDLAQQMRQSDRDYLAEQIRQSDRLLSAEYKSEELWQRDY